MVSAGTGIEGHQPLSSESSVMWEQDWEEESEERVWVPASRKSQCPAISVIPFTSDPLGKTEVQKLPAVWDTRTICQWKIRY